MTPQFVNNKFQYDEVTGLRFPTSLLGQAKAYSHIYYVDGLLIDTGHSRRKKEVIATTNDLVIKKIFVTHHHEDHTGNALSLQQKFNCEIFGSEKCCELMKNPPKLSFAQKLYWGLRPSQPNIKHVSNLIETDKFKFQIIPIPGHAEDMVALYEPERKWLFSSDLYVNSHIGYFLYSESMSRQIESIGIVLKLDFEVMFCSHNPKFEDAKSKLEKKLNFLENFQGEVQALYGKGYLPKAIMREMKLKEYTMIKLLSGGDLSKLNMVKSVIREIKEK